jgi:hypothetical protein
MKSKRNRVLKTKSKRKRRKRSRRSRRKNNNDCGKKWSLNPNGVFIRNAISTDGNVYTTNPWWTCKVFKNI